MLSAHAPQGDRYHMPLYQADGLELRPSEVRTLATRLGHSRHERGVGSLEL